ncbi:MAG: DUF624 domain-containing protein [Eubacteriales bacterium]|nr:DUF624 domain-containing protein [Eubacteriales bacterium]
MARLFDMDNPVWRFMGRVADTFLLTLFWLIGSLPLLTIGASSAALYTVTLRMAQNREGYLWKSFWQAYRDNFRQSTVLWLILVLLGAFFGVDLYWYHRLEGPFGTFGFWLFAVLAFLYLLTAVMVFPLTARLDAGVRRILFFSFMTALKNFGWTLFLLVGPACFLALGLFVFWPFLFFWPGATGYVSALILTKFIFPKYHWDEQSGARSAGGEGEDEDEKGL